MSSLEIQTIQSGSRTIDNWINFLLKSKFALLTDLFNSS